MEGREDEPGIKKGGLRRYKIKGWGRELKILDADSGLHAIAVRCVYTSVC